LVNSGVLLITAAGETNRWAVPWKMKSIVL